MNGFQKAVGGWASEVAVGWSKFWFRPDRPETLGIIRLCAGLMLFYTHLVWSLELNAFLGPNSWVSNDLARELAGSPYKWSYLHYTDSPILIWTLHIVGLVVIGMFAVGFQTRITSILSLFFALSYVHRLEGSLFGLDQMNVMLTTYLMLGPSGDAYSVDRWLKERKLRREQAVVPEPSQYASTGANFAIRMMQIHLCIIYMFGGIGKSRGELWWDGSAIWVAAANQEYQSLSMTWLGHFPFVIAFASHLTVFWELYYCALVWPRLSRPIAIAVGVGMHLGIAMFMGMITFGVIMIIVNLAFIEPRLIRATTDWFGRRLGMLPAQGRAGESESTKRPSSKPTKSNKAARATVKPR